MGGPPIKLKASKYAKVIHLLTQLLVVTVSAKLKSCDDSSCFNKED